MSAAKAEISHYQEYDYLVINEDFYRALEEIKSIVLSNRLRQDRMAEVLEKRLGSLIS